MRVIVAALFSLLALGAFSQDSSRMETDRPDQTESPYITKRKYLQAEFGFNLEKSGGLHTIVVPSALWKYGLHQKFELRLITEIHSQETPLMIPQGNSYETGLLPIKLGGKLALWEERGLLPKTSLIAHVAFPKLAGKYFKANQLAPEFRFTMQHTLSSTMGIGYNVGAEWDGFSNTPYWIYTLAPGFNLGKNGYMYLELFGEWRKGWTPSHNFDLGFAYYLGDNAKLDISSGFNLANTSENYIALGFSFRLGPL